MVTEMKHYFFWSSLIISALACRAFGHEAPAPAAPLDLQQDTAATRVVLPCTLPQVLYTALKNNATLEIARLDPEIADTAITEARGAFDPSFNAAYTAQTDHSPQTVASTLSLTTPTGLGDVADALTQLDRLLNELQGPRESVIAAHTNDTSAGVQQLFTTGAVISLNGNVSGGSTDLTDEEYQAGVSVALRQPLLRGFGRRIGTITIRQARNQAQQSEQNLLATVLSTIRQAETAYWDLVLARELVKIRAFGVTLAQEQYDRSNARFTVGKGIEADVFAARAELATRQADFSDAQADIHARTISLLQLIKPEGNNAWRCDLDPGPAPGVSEVTLDEEGSVTTALDRRPELLQARLEIERQDLDVRLRKNELLPDLDVVASYGRRGEGGSFGGSTEGLGSSRLENYSVGIEFQTSLTKRSEKARLMRARLSADQAARLLRRDEDSVAGEVRQAVITARKRWQRIGANLQAVEARQQELEIERGRNMSGKTTTLDVLQVQRDLLQAQTDEATTRIGYLQALAALYAAEGTLLERHGIVFQAEEK
jgi:outer membrane protein